jgi:hypothetical protein
MSREEEKKKLHRNNDIIQKLGYCIISLYILQHVSHTMTAMVTTCNSMQMKDEDKCRTLLTYRDGGIGVTINC